MRYLVFHSYRKNEAIISAHNKEDAALKALEKAERRLKTYGQSDKGLLFIAPTSPRRQR